MKILSRVCGDYTRRGLDCQLDLLDLDTGTLDYSVYTSQLTRSWDSLRPFRLATTLTASLAFTKLLSLGLLLSDCSLSEIYDLWTDYREDTAFGIVDCLAVTRKRLPSGLRRARYQATSTPRRARHNIIFGEQPIVSHGIWCHEAW
jgi:hypothetical protein